MTQRTSVLRVKLKERFILHLHGHVDDPETIILSRSAYDQILLDDAVKPFIQTVFHTRVVLFIGFGFSDPHIDDLLRDLQSLKVLGGATVFALLPSPRQFDSVRHENLRSRSINAIYIPQGNDHGVVGIRAWLANLSRVVNRIRLSEEKSAAKVCPPHLTEFLKPLLSQGEWISEFAKALSTLPDRPDLARLVSDGIRPSDVSELFTRIGSDELRSVLMVMNSSHRDTVLEDALSCLPPA